MKLRTWNYWKSFPDKEVFLSLNLFGICFLEVYCVGKEFSICILNFEIKVMK